MLYNANALFIPETGRKVNRFPRMNPIPPPISPQAMNSSPLFRVLFVCLGNICRSPAAEIAFHAALAGSGMAGRVSADSCGTASYHIGSKPDSRMLGALRRAGLAYGGHRARAFCRADFARFDLIIPQDAENESDLLRLARTAEEKGKIRGMWSYFGASETVREVPDPYYGTEDDFDAVVALLQRSMPRLLEDIRKRLVGKDA